MNLTQASNQNSSFKPTFFHYPIKMSDVNEHDRSQQTTKEHLKEKSKIYGNN